MISMADFWLVILYILLCILVVVLIVLGLRLIKTIDKTNKMLDDVNGKLDSVNGVFNAFSLANNFINDFGEKTVGFLSNKFGNIFKKGEDEDE